MTQQVPFYAHAPLGQASSSPPPPSSLAVASAPVATVWRVAGTAASAALAYHGYKRTGSVGWALVWAIAGGLVWPAGLAIAFAQGFGRPAVRKNRRRSR